MMAPENVSPVLGDKTTSGAQAANGVAAMHMVRCGKDPLNQFHEVRALIQLCP